MYAIQSGKKFLNARFFLDPNEVFELTVSGTPKTYKTRSEAERVAGLIREYVERSVANYTEMIKRDQTEVDRAEKDVARLEAQLADLIEQPYKEVVKKVPQVERKLEQARWKIESSSVATATKDLRRMEQIRAAAAAVVKVQQVVEAL